MDKLPEKRSPGWPQVCLKSWRDALARWMETCEGKTLSAAAVQNMHHALQCNLLYIDELEGKLATTKEVAGKELEDRIAAQTHGDKLQKELDQLKRLCGEVVGVHTIGVNSMSFQVRLQKFREVAQKIMDHFGPKAAAPAEPEDQTKRCDKCGKMVFDRWGAAVSVASEAGDLCQCSPVEPHPDAARWAPQGIIEYAHQHRSDPVYAGLHQYQHDGAKPRRPLKPRVVQDEESCPDCDGVGWQWPDLGVNIAGGYAWALAAAQSAGGSVWIPCKCNQDRQKPCPPPTEPPPYGAWALRKEVIDVGDIIDRRLGQEGNVYRDLHTLAVAVAHLQRIHQPERRSHDQATRSPTQ